LCVSYNSQGEMQNAFKILIQNPKEGGHLGGVGVRILYEVMYWFHAAQDRIFCEHSDAHSGPVEKVNLLTS